MKTFLHSATLLVVLLIASLGSNAQLNTDLPNPNKNMKALPVGSFIIAMDNTLQAGPGYFNLKAYGLIVTLQNAGIRLRWIIDSGKVHDGVDFSVQAERLAPTFLANDGVPKNFKAGPFVIFPNDTSVARYVIQLYNNTITTANQRVNVYRSLSDVMVPVRYDLFGVKPKAAILNDGGKGAIHAGYFTTAGIPTTNFAVLDSAVNLYQNCYTFASEPHNDGSATYPIERIVDSLNAFVLNGGNFLAQCAAVRTYENSRISSTNPADHIQSSNGWDDATIISKTTANVAYQNPDLSFAQFEGTYIPNQAGSMQTWNRFVGGVAINNFYPVISGLSAATDSVFGASVSKHKTGKGGLIFYIGNHQFAGSNMEDLNGQRMYMNAFLTPAAYGDCPLYNCTGPSCGPLPVTLKYFKARKTSNGQQVQLNWVTSTELNAKEFIVERSLDGFSFVGIGRVNAKGMSAVDVPYSLIDKSPASGYNYYRLTEVSNDRVATYSDVVTVYFSGKAGMVDIYPVPSRQSITVDLGTLPVNNSTISIFDVTGKMIMSNYRVMSNTVKLDVRNYAAGTYILKVISEDGTILQNKFVVVKD